MNTRDNILYGTRHWPGRQQSERLEEMVEMFAIGALHREQTITRDQLTSFGMLPELLACFGTITEVDRVDEETLARLVGCIDFRRLPSASV